MGFRAAVRANAISALQSVKINDHGQIGAMAIVRSGPNKGNVRSFLATPVKQSMGESVADAGPARPRSNFPAKKLISRFLIKMAR